jgi:hypothetical protein
MTNPDPTSGGPAPIDHFDRLTRVLRGLRSVVAPAQIVRVIADEGLTPLGAQGAALAVPGTTTRLVVHVAGPASRDDVAAIGLFDPGDRGPLAAAVIEPLNRWFPGADDARRAYPALPADATQAGAVLSLVSDEHPIGALAVAFAEPRRLSSAERMYLLALADAAAVALVGCTSTIALHDAGLAAEGGSSVAFTRRVLTQQFGISRKVAAVVERHRLVGATRQDLVSIVDDIDTFSRSLRRRLDEGS